MTMTVVDESVARKLPLWRDTLEQMLKDGIEYGKAYTTPWFEEKLCAKRKTLRFEIGIHRIRKSLYPLGYYITARGQNEAGYVIALAEENWAVGLAKMRRAIREIGNGYTLVRSTPTAQMTDGDRRRHEQALERLEIKASMIAGKNPGLRLQEASLKTLTNPEN